MRMGEPGGDLDLAQEASRPQRRGQLRTEDFEGDPPAVFTIVGQIDGGHAAVAELSGDRVALGKSDLKAVCRIAHRTHRTAHRTQMYGRSAVAGRSRGGGSRSDRERRLALEAGGPPHLAGAPPGLPDDLFY